MTPQERVSRAILTIQRAELNASAVQNVFIAAMKHRAHTELSALEVCYVLGVPQELSIELVDAIFSENDEEVFLGVFLEAYNNLRIGVR